MKHVIISLSLAIISSLVGATMVSAHCEIPCGIYDDQLRAQLIFEHTTTIEKSMQQIQKLAQKSPADQNQLVRWITNKEAHADKIQHIVSQYFMTQRIKPAQEAYGEKLALLHQMLISAMKCKQTIDVKHVEALRQQLEKFKQLYFKSK
jgi:nickel superoxide dismutase